VQNGRIPSTACGTESDSIANEAQFSDQKLTTPLPTWFFGPYRKGLSRDEERRWINALSCYDLEALTEFLEEPPASGRVTRPQPASGTIYFVGPEGGPIKIGFASRLEFRLKDLRTANAYPLKVHATVEGPPKLERDYHQRFAAHRLHGEWFTPHPDILAEVERLASQPPAALFRRAGR
jgi:hypothetical protein